ncbi:hypothetical protein [Pseudanabaena sp. PCC 6802]|uniref:hypothetical protein n=1 Tax=Pseudanabaena sp. PCC 6802 TaxID=118173 RepID=UPI00036042F9|nr:hypothetical protein [Pseudanabaena sp. PCC 6802]
MINLQIRETTTTSLRQECFREEVFEGSRIANRRADEQKCHRRLRPLGELAQHNKTSGSRGTVNDTVAAGQFTFLSGEVCKVAVLRVKGV